MSAPAILLLALALDAVLGEPPALWSRVPHPAVAMGRAIGWADRRFNRGRNRVAKGAAVMAGLGLAVWLVGVAVAGLPDAGLAEIALLAALLAQRSLVAHVGAVADALARSVAEARGAAGDIVGRDLASADAPAVARAAIESAAENLSDGLVAPVFWYLLLGLPGVLLYKLVNTADSMIGYRTPRHEAFGRAAARIDDAANWVPARLTALGLAALHGGLRGWSGIRADAGRHRSPNAGWPEAAMARALGVALSGPRVYAGVEQPFPFVNAGGRREAGPAEVRGAVDALWRVWWALLATAAVLAAA